MADAVVSGHVIGFTASGLLQRSVNLVSLARH